MAIPGGGGPGKSRPRRVVRRKPPPKPAAAIPGLGVVARPSRPARAPRPTPRQVQRVTAQARPLSPRPVRPKPVPVAGRRAVALVPGLGEARGATKPLQATPPRNIRAGKPVRTAQQRRAVAVAAYDELTGDEKHAHVNEAHRRAVAGKATQTDKAILHAHRTRVEGTKKVARAQRAFDVLSPETTAPKLAAAVRPKKTTRETTGMLATAIIHPKGVADALRAVGAASAAGWKSVGAPKIVQNAPKDIAEIAVTTPSSIAKLGSDVVHHPRRVPGELAAPYVELYHHPKQFIESHPVSAALMVAPAARVPGRVVGKGARIAGKQALARPAATLPHTTLREARTGSRDYVLRAVQKRQDVKRGAPTMTQAQVQRRVDEFYDAGKQHVQAATRSAAKEAKRRGLKGERAAEHVSGAKGGAKHEVDRRFAREFGTPVHVGHIDRPEAPKPGTREFAQVIQRRNKVAPLQGRGATHGERSAADAAATRILDKAHLEQGSTGRIRPKQVKAILTPRNAAQGHLFDSRADAEMIAERLNAHNAMVARGAHGMHQAARRGAPVPLEFAVRDAGYGQFAVVPKVAAERLHKQQVVGSSEAPGAKYMRTAGRSFRSAVLPLSAKWLFGQVGEAGFRSAVAGAGPADLVRVNRVVRQMNKVNPGSGDRFLQRIHGGQFDLTGTAREFAEGRTLAEEFKGTALEDVAHGATKVANVRPVKAIRRGWGQYSRVVFDVVNGSIETTARKAMAGQAIRRGQFMDKRLLGLTDRAIDEAARGLQGTDAQVQVARAVDRMYGQYQKFSPEKREHLLHTTPFWPWYSNMVRFLTQTLPGDHPLKAALAADLDAATEDWRKAHGLSLRQGGGKPGFLQGTYPVGGKGQVVPVGRYLPFAPGEPLQAVGDLFLPQYANVQDVLKGVDWKGQEIKSNKVPGELAKSVVEAHVPGAGQIGRVTGLSARYLQGKKDEPTVFSGKDVKGAVVHELSPFPATKPRPSAQGGGRSAKTPLVKVKRVRLKPVRVRRVRVGGR